MNELLKVSYDSERPTVSARDLYKALEVGTEFRHWFPRMCVYGFEEGSDYTPVIFDHPQNGQPTQDYQLAIPMAKEIAMLQRTEKGKEVRQYFIQIEENWNRPEMVLARANKIQAAMLDTANAKVFHLESENATLKPKAEIYDFTMSAEGLYSMEQVAKILAIPNMGQNNLFAYLRRKKVIQPSLTRPYQEFINREYFKLIESIWDRGDGNKFASYKTMVSQKGIAYITRLLIDDGYKPREYTQAQLALI